MLDRNSELNNQVGWIDEFGSAQIRGWCGSIQGEQFPATLDIIVDGKPIGTAIANQYRQDLKEAGVQAGYAAFTFEMPDAFCDGTQKQVVVQRKDDGVQVGEEFIFKNFRLTSDERVQKFYDAAIERDLTNRADAAKELFQLKKAAIFVTYSTLDFLAPAQMKIYNWLVARGFYVLIVHARGSRDVGAFKHSARVPLLLKHNIGYDFGSWICGLEWLRTVCGSYDALEQIVLVNDSVFGPLMLSDNFDDQLFNPLAGDVVGAVDSYQETYHVQSFLIAINRRALEAKLLDLFCKNYSFSSDKSTVIKEGEVGFSKLAMELGLSIAAVYPYEFLVDRWTSRYCSPQSHLETDRNGGRGREQLSLLKQGWVGMISDKIATGEPLNPSHHFFDILCDEGYPFLKREVITKNVIEHPFLYERLRVISESIGSVESKIIRQASQQFGGFRAIYI
jgi:hypothetical protein